MHAYETIVVGIDFSPLGMVALEAAARAANMLETARLHLVHVARMPILWPAEGVGIATAGVWNAVLEGARADLSKVSVRANKARITRDARMGGIAQELVAAAHETHASMIVVASHRRGRLGRFLLGSVANALLRVSPCPVLVVSEDRALAEPPRRILAAVDGSRTSASVVRHALSIAAQTGARVEAFSMLELRPMLAKLPHDPELSAAIDDLLEAQERRHRLEIDKLVEGARRGEVSATVQIEYDGSPRATILDRVERTGSDLLVAGSSGHNAWERLVLGSTVTHLVANAPCPVLVVPHEDAATRDQPVTVE